MRSQNNRGFTLLSVVMATVILAILSYVFTGYINMSSKMQTYAKVQEDFIDVRRYVDMNLSCPGTLGTPAIRPTECGATSPYLNIKKNDGSVLIKNPYASTPNDFTVISTHYYLRASCVTCTNPPCPASNLVLLIEAARMDSPGVISQNALKGRESYDWKDLYGGIPVPCVIP